VEKLAPLVAEIESAGGRVHALALDAREEGNVQAAFESIERELGPIAVVVFNGANVNPARGRTATIRNHVSALIPCRHVA
jgi:NAD(P)-dependent dehydrogenase (short-subunit alcohol dehydrogenase family)